MYSIFLFLISQLNLPRLSCLSSLARRGQTLEAPVGRQQERRLGHPYRAALAGISRPLY